jgi:hypothetical protein
MVPGPENLLGILSLSLTARLANCFPDKSKLAEENFRDIEEPRDKV